MHDEEVSQTGSRVILLILCVLFVILFMLSGCNTFKPIAPVVVKVQPAKVKIPVFYSPEKSILDPVKFDWPREADLSTIKNSKMCKEEYNKIYGNLALPVTPRTHPKFWKKCRVAAIDLDSNLYIGLDVINYKNLVNNNKMLMQREKRWMQLLKRINTLIQDQNQKPVESIKDK